jgi:integrase
MKKLKGIRRKGKKWEVYVRVSGTLRTSTFDELDVPKMRAWQEQQRGSAPGVPVKGSFAEDVAAHLAKPVVAAMPSIDQRRAHLLLAIEALGADRPSASITSDDIESMIQAWLKAGLAPATVYHRRSSLSSFFTMLHGASGSNPVRGTTKPPPWTPRDQSVTREALLRILAAMPNERRPMKGIRQPSTARLVTRVLMETGVRGADLLKVRRRDLDWQAGTVIMPRSAKGKGVQSWTCHLTPDALEAWRAFDAANLYESFSLAAVSHSFKRAARRVLGPDTAVHLYSLRHSVGADIYRTTRDLATVGRLLGHTPNSPVTEQYARGAHEEVDRQALVALVAARAAAVPGAATTQLAAQLAGSTKSRKRKQLQIAM